MKAARTGGGPSAGTSRSVSKEAISPPKALRRTVTSRPPIVS